MSLAIAASASFLVTHDKDLLSLMTVDTADAIEFRRKIPEPANYRPSGDAGICKAKDRKRRVMSQPKLTAPKGFADILPTESWKWQAIESIAHETASLYHFQEIRTPILESTALFHRGVGETTDIVHKETFTFLDRGGDSMTMRPEGTAGVVPHGDRSGVA